MGCKTAKPGEASLINSVISNAALQLFRGSGQAQKNHRAAERVSVFSTWMLGKRTSAEVTSGFFTAMSLANSATAIAAETLALGALVFYRSSPSKGRDHRMTLQS